MTEMGVSICPILRLAADVSKSCHAQTLANTPKPLTAYTANASRAADKLAPNTEKEMLKTSPNNRLTITNAIAISALLMQISGLQKTLRDTLNTWQFQNAEIIWLWLLILEGAMPGSKQMEYLL
jgi:hypothetical protein